MKLCVARKIQIYDMDAKALQILQARIVFYICTEGFFKCSGCSSSSGCFEDLGRRAVLTQGPWTFVWQPMSGFDQKRNLIYFLIQHKDKQFDLKRRLKNFEQCQQIIDQMVVDSCRAIVDKSEGHWMQRSDISEAHCILNFREGWTVKNNQFRSCIEIVHLGTPCSIQAWTPHKVKEFLEDHDAQSPNAWDSHTIDNEEFIENLKNSGVCVKMD